ncbi:hypothetical protein Droror1_Dr00013011 [Drosera rotundifolia]
MEGGGVSMRKGEEGQSGLEIVVSRDMPNHESPPPLSPPPTSDTEAESEDLRSPSSGNGSSRCVPKREILVNLFAILLLILYLPITLLVFGARAFFEPGILKELPHVLKEQRYVLKNELVLFIVLFPLFLLFLPLFLLVLGACAFFGINLPERGKKRRKRGIFEKVEEFLDPAVRQYAKLVFSMIRNRVLLVILLWLIINLSIAGLRKKNVLGSKLWKWTLLIVILSCGYRAISMVSHLCLYFLELIFKDKKDKKEILYHAKGLRPSINLVIFSCSLLLIWHFYFRSDHGLKQTSGSDKVFDLGTPTLISLLIFALLWLLRSILLLKWEAHVVYKRFLDRILRAGFQVYFLALMSGKELEIFRPEGNRSSEETQEEGDTNDNNSGLSGEATIPEGNKTEKQRKAKGSQESSEENKNGAEDIPPAGDQQKQEDVLNDNNNASLGDSTIPGGNKAEKQTKKNGNRGSHEENRKRAKDILHVEQMLSKNVSTYAIRRMAKYFVALKVSSREGGDATTDIFAKFPRDHDYVTKEDLSDRFQLDDKDAELLYKQLQGGKSEVSYEMFKDWVMKALNNCLTLGQTLLDAKKVVNCLKNILNCFVFAMFILLWLLLTEIATTKVLVLIASQLLAASFIFGDTCKAMFEGIIFAFIKHPFDVGDLCVIDETEMEVKEINILTTTFRGLDTKQDALYPNSVLAVKAIINLKFEPDLNDTIELSLDFSTQRTHIDALEMKIKNYIVNNEKFEGFGHVKVKHIENNIKIVVPFKHKMSTLDGHSQCREKKNNQRTEFLLQIKDYLDELQIKPANALPFAVGRK